MPLLDRSIARAEIATDRFLNPILQREIRGTFRGVKFLAILVVLLLLLGASLLVAAAALMQTRGIVNPMHVGGMIHAVFFLGMSLVILFIMPSFAATSVVSERERDTADLLKTTALSDGSIVRGKFLAAMAYATILLAAALPLGSISFLFGGVTIANLAAAYFALMAMAAAVNMFSIFVSTQTRRSRTSLSAAMVFSVAFVVIAATLANIEDLAGVVSEVSGILGLEPLTRLRYMEMPGLHGGLWWLCIVAVPAYLFSAVMVFSYCSAVNKLKPWSGNKSTNIRAFYAVYMPLGILLASEILIAVDPVKLAGFGIMPAYKLIGLFNSFFAVLLILMLLSTYFSTEDPEWLLPPRQRSAWQGRLRWFGTFGPGSLRGFTFAILSNVVALAVFFLPACAVMRTMEDDFPDAFTSSHLPIPILYSFASAMALVFLFASAGLLSSVLFGNDMVRKGIVSMIVIALVFVPLGSFAASHSLKEIETADFWDFGFLSPIVAVGSLGTGYWETVRPLTPAEAEQLKSVFPFRMDFFGTTVPVFAGFVVFSSLAGAAFLAAYALRRRVLLRREKCAACNLP